MVKYATMENNYGTMKKTMVLYQKQWNFGFMKEKTR